MSYVTGVLNTFESRLHQFPTTTGDLQKFFIEGSGYISQYTGAYSGSNKIITPALLGKWEHEGRQQNYRITKSGIALAQKVFVSTW